MLGLMGALPRRQVAMCAPVVQGYGLTETCAASFVGVPDQPVRWAPPGSTGFAAQM